MSRCPNVLSSLRWSPSQFEYQDNAAKGHGGKEDAIKVMRKYGGDEKQR